MIQIKYRNFIYIICLSLAQVFITGCATIYNPATERNELIFIQTGSEISIGKVVSKQIELSRPLSKDKDKLARLNLIGEKISRVSDRQDLKYVFKIVKDKELNAFSLPGGLVYINTGLMDKANDDELACVVAHEVAHIAAKHAVKKLQVSLGYSILMNIAFRKASSLELTRATSTMFNVISLGYSREDERLSDRLAVKYALKAGYDANGMVTFFEILKEEHQKQGVSSHLVFLQSHPAVDERIKNVKEEINRLKNIKDTPAATPTTPATKTGPKTCPTCAKIYPKNYKFCTVDGSKLIVE